MRYLHHLLFVLLLAATLVGQKITTSGFLGAAESIELLRPATDTDGDGLDDFVAVVVDRTVPSSSTYRVLLLSGSDGSLLHQLSVAQQPIDVLGFGDANGDGFGDIVVVDSVTRVYSGATGLLLYIVPQQFLSVCELGDVDGNGRDDFAGVYYDNAGQNFIVPMRGENGISMGGLPALANPNAQCTIRNAGDVSGDGKADIAFCPVNSAPRVVDGVTGALLHVMVMTGSISGNHMETIDLDSDGRREVLILRSQQVQRVEVYDGAVGSLRFSVAAPPGPPGNVGFNACEIGDIDQDGFVDFVVLQRTLFGELMAVSGFDGRTLWTLAGPPLAHMGWYLAPLDDVDGDGYRDFACSFDDGAFGGFAGDGWHLISTKILAEVTEQAGACGGGPFLPRLGMTRPVLGSATTIVGLDGPVGVNGILAFSLRPPLPTYLGVGSCYAYFDLGAGVPLLAVTQPNWSVALPIPAVPQFAGLPIALQCIYSPTAGALGLDLSNGLWARVGYQ